MDPQDIVKIERSGFRLGVLSVVLFEAAIVGVIFTDTTALRKRMATTLNKRWTKKGDLDERTEPAS